MYNNYLVYKHTTPSNKVYIGITKYEPEQRWLNNGRGYRSLNIFFNAIIKYGWINIKHEILAEELTEQEALDLEEYYIREYKSYDRRYGYNLLLRGGNYYTEYINDKKQNSRRKTITTCNKPKYDGNGKKVIKIDNDGNIIKTYLSVASAARELNLPIETLRTRLNINKILEYGLFKLKYLNEKTPKIGMYSINDELIQVFKSIGEAYKYLHKSNKGHISKCCNNLALSYLNLKWKYIYED